MTAGISGVKVYFRKDSTHVKTDCGNYGSGRNGFELVSYIN